MRRMLAVTALAGLTLPVGPPSASAAAPTCSIQANHFGSPVHFTAAVNCTAGTAILGCVATAWVVDDDTQVRSDAQHTAQGVCGSSYSTTAAPDSLLLGGTHHIEATYSFAILDDAATFTNGGDTAALQCQSTGQAYACTATSTSYLP